jgi:hypothetical protein
MNYRFKVTMGAVGVLALGAGLWSLGSGAGGEPSTARTARVPAPVAERAARRTAREPASESAPCDVECIERVRKAARDARVVEALARVERRTGHITREVIEREQEHLAMTAQALHARETEMPTIEDEVDANGAHWKKLAYADGAVRYELPEEP